jgi:hypothetical protein
MSWLDDLLGFRSLISPAGVEMPQRKHINVRADGLIALADNASLDATDLDFRPTTSGTMVGGYQRLQRVAHATTTDATPTIIDFYSIPAKSHVTARGMITLYNTAKGSGITFSGSARRNATAISTMNSPTANMTFMDFGAEGASATTATLTVASNQLRITVTGEAATDYEWQLFWELLVWTAP